MKKIQIRISKTLPKKMRRGFLHEFSYLIMLISLSFSFNASSQDVQSIRVSFFSLDEKDCGWMDFVESLDKNESAVAMAYKGSALAASAQCVNGPFNKLKQFNKGRDFLEKAVALEPDNAEIRFLRYQVKRESPWILNYKDLDEDKSILIKEVMKENSSMDAFLMNKMREYLLNKADLSYLEKEKINSLNHNSNRDG
ncbi:MAG: hypothetical protein U5Q03_20535 [Bacteroidota bacterium]|nr:hypothetical protein [Bacteroidota bacterium]